MSMLMSSLRHLSKYRSLQTGYNKLTNVHILPFNNIVKRHIFTDELLMIDKFVETRNRISSQFGDMKDKFLSRMLEYIDADTNMVFTEDLKNVVFLAEDNEQHLELITKMIKKFNSQNESLRFGTFVFGPIVMRLMHVMGKYEMAVSLIKDPHLNGFFSQLSSMTLILDLLYKNQKYEQVLDLFNFMHDNVPLETKYPRDCVLLVFASCYKLNTEQSFNYAVEVLRSSREVGAKITRRALSLFAALAIKQKQSGLALEALSLASQSNYITVKNLRIMALSDLKRIDDVITIFKVMLNKDTPPNATPEGIFRETLNIVKHAIESMDDNEVKHQFMQIEKALNEGGQITESPLDSFLDAPVKPLVFENQPRVGFRNYRPYPVRQSNEGMRATGYRDQRPMRSRQGLSDPENE